MAFMIAALIAAVAIPWAATVTMAEPAVGWDGPQWDRGDDGHGPAGSVLDRVDGELSLPRQGNGRPVERD